MVKYILFIAFGILSGVIAGMGMGGGTLLIPLLTIFMNVNQHQAQALNLLSFIPMAVVSLVIHVKNKLVKLKGLGLFIFIAVLSSVLGSFIANKMNGDLLGKLFGGFLILLSLYQFLCCFSQKE